MVVKKFLFIAKIIYVLFAVLTIVMLIFTLSNIGKEGAADSPDTAMGIFAIISIVYLVILAVTIITLIINIVLAFRIAVHTDGIKTLLLRMAVGLLAGLAISVAISLIKSHTCSLGPITPLLTCPILAALPNLFHK